MSEGRDKLNDFSLLKSLVGESKLAQKPNRSGVKHPAQGANKSRKPNERRNNPKPQRVMTSQVQDMTVRIPQYGQVINPEIIAELENPVANQEQVVVSVDVDKEKAKEEQRLFKWLCKRFPKCFNPKEKKPLKVGISQDIEVIYHNEFFAPVDQYILRNVLRRYVGDTRYQQAVFDLKQRYDLYGKVVEDLAPNHVDYAKRRLEEIAEKAELRAKGINIREYYAEKRAKAKAEREAQKQQAESVPANTDDAQPEA